MAEPDKQYTGDGNDNYANAAQKTAEVAKQAGQASAQNAAAAGSNAATTSAAAGAEATANAAAATVKASIEGGKAVAEVAAGTAAGGPWGAIIAAAWAMRHTLFKILIFICLSLLFIIVMVVSLPSIIVNSIFQTDPTTVSASGSTNILEIYEEMSAVVSDSVTGGYDYARAEVERIIINGGYDYDLSTEATIDYGRVSADYDVCYIFAAYSASMGQRGTSKYDLKSKLDSVAHLMFLVTYEEKEHTVIIPAEDDEDEPTVEIIQYVECTIHPFDASIILTAFNINPDTPYNQFGIRTGDAIESMALALKRTLYGVTGAGQVPAITDAELIAFLNNLTCSPARKELVRVGLSLVGRVPYFWGGKSAPGWNEDWNKPRLVTAAGSSSTGTIRPFGLDCSGFTDWVYKTALGHSLHSGASWHQWDNSYAITESELLPGDLGFMAQPGTVPVNHILMYAGKDSSGKHMWLHSASGAGGVVFNSPSYVRFYRRVSGIDLETMVVQGGAVGAFSAQEVEWLAALVYYEARGMDMYCRELTAQVAINRLRSTKFPNSLESVLRAPGQYATADRIFSGAYTAHIGTSTWAYCMEAAHKVASGLSVDENGKPWPSNVLYQHSFESATRLGTGLFRTFRSGSQWMHFNFG
jgi:hypothetical protein